MVKNKKFLVFSILSLFVFVLLSWLFIENKQPNKTVKDSDDLSAVQTLQTATSSLNIYRNEEYGFEFQYPEGWTFHENTFGSPFSKFNIIGASKDENQVPDPVNPSFLVNVVTLDFVDRQFLDLKDAGSVVSVGGVNGVKYEYNDSGLSEVSIILPIGDYKLILGTNERYKSSFDQIVSTFKFLQ